MSFPMTVNQFRNKTKTVTRRFGWHFLLPGAILQGVEKARGLKKGERINHLGTIRILSVRKEPLNEITQEDCIKEGFPEMNPEAFIFMFCREMRCVSYDSVKRIEFEYL